MARRLEPLPQVVDAFRGFRLDLRGLLHLFDRRGLVPGAVRDPELVRQGVQEDVPAAAAPVLHAVERRREAFADLVRARLRRFGVRELLLEALHLVLRVLDLALPGFLVEVGVVLGVVPGVPALDRVSFLLRLRHGEFLLLDELVLRLRHLADALDVVVEELPLVRRGASGPFHLVGESLCLVADAVDRIGELHVLECAFLVGGALESVRETLDCGQDAGHGKADRAHHHRTRLEAAELRRGLCDLFAQCLEVPGERVRDGREQALALIGLLLRLLVRLLGGLLLPDEVRERRVRGLAGLVLRGDLVVDVLVDVSHSPLPSSARRAS